MSSALKVELTQEYIATRIPKMTDYTETTFNEQPAREYPDGSIRNEQGHWLTRHPGSASVIDSERSQELHARKADKRQAQRDDYEAEAQRAFVREVARGKSLAQAGAVLVGNIAAEIAPQDAVKEHGLKNYTAASEWALKQVGLIKEKEQESTVNIDKAVFLAPGTREHVAGLLQSLVAGDEADASSDGQHES